MRYIREFWKASATTLALAIVPGSSPRTAMDCQEQQPPLGWVASVDVPCEYAVRTDVARRIGGSGFFSGTILSAMDQPGQSGFLQQSIRADLYRGKRVRFTGYVKANLDFGQAGLFVRIDGREAPLASDYMIGRLIQATKDWERYSVVIDVPRDAIGITFGLDLTGAGQAWLDDAAFDVVGADVPTTLDTSHAQDAFSTVAAGARGASLGDRYRRASFYPINLSFEQMRPFAS
jgi:hypothetical protein